MIYKKHKSSNSPWIKAGGSMKAGDYFGWNCHMIYLSCKKGVHTLFLHDGSKWNLYPLGEKLLKSAVPKVIAAYVSVCPGCRDADRAGMRYIEDRQQNLFGVKQ